MIEGKSVLAVVPARAGSKGIKGKNLRSLGGLSLLGHVAEAVRASKYVDETVVSTEDEKIALDAEKHGLRVPFKRPPELATDEALSVEVWRHAWQATSSIDKRKYPFSVLLEPSSPFRSSADIDSTLEALVSTGAPSALTVSPLPAHHSPEKALILGESAEISFHVKSEKEVSLRQLLPPYFVRNGLCYASHFEFISSDSRIVVEGSAAVVTSRVVVNLDSELDFAFAQWFVETHRNSN